MNYAEICWYGALAFGLIAFLIAIGCMLLRKDWGERQAKAAVLLFVANWIMYIPEELFNDIPDSLLSLKVIESILAALLKTFNIYLGDGAERIGYTGHPLFMAGYECMIMVINITLLVIVAGFVIRFFEGPFQRLMLFFRKRRDAYIFSDCNEKTLTIAESIDPEKKNIIFACSEGGPDGAQKERIRAINGFFFEKTTAEILKGLIKKAGKIEVFLFGSREEDNLAELDKVCESAGTEGKAHVRVYAELCETPWSFYDEYLKQHNTTDERFVINFVRTEETFAYNDLLQYSIFEHAAETEESPEKEIKVLLVGMNARNLEMLKAILHLSQMPGYRLTVMVLDTGAGRSILRRKMPEIDDECDKVGNAVYRLIYKENVLLESDSFEQIIGEEFADFTFAFIHVGEDLQNANLAMRLNALRARKNDNGNYRIQVNIERDRMAGQWNGDLTEKMDFVGSRRKVYDYDFITMSDLEKATVAIHNVRYPLSDPARPSWVSYCNNEYNRHSVYARTLAFRYKMQLIEKYYDADYSITAKDNVWKIYEHMRWNVYTRTQGYVLADKELLDASGELDKKTRTVARVHNDLVDYEELTKEEQDKDALVLSPEIVAILQSI